ncbi:MAG: protein kinase [Polyangiaceae bacterium]|nr:protein kinase [Polyangiaceae bacterium]
MRLRRSIGPYELLRVLDTGGMGKVYLAKETRRGQPGRHVVVKTIRSELEQAPEHVAAFQRETRILARLQHPNIVRLYDAGRAGTRLFMVMEYLEGLDVAKMLRLLASSGRRLPLALVVRVGIEAARALHAAHAYTSDSGKLAGLVHRDLSPHNVFVLYDGRVKLLDFGLARAYGETATTSDGMVKGKFRYLAPEQARSEELDGRVDIFTLGLVMHEMITGRRAYDQTGDVEVLRAAMQGHFQRLGALAPDTPGPLLRVIERAVRSARDERYPSAAAMADDLSQAAAELRLPVGAVEQQEFLAQMRALADASPLATPVEPSGRLSSNVRSSLASVADIDAEDAALVRPPPRRPRLGLLAGGLGAAVGAVAAIVNLASFSAHRAQKPSSELAPSGASLTSPEPENVIDIDAIDAAVAAASAARGARPLSAPPEGKLAARPPSATPDGEASPRTPAGALAGEALLPQANAAAPGAEGTPPPAPAPDDAAAPVALKQATNALEPAPEASAQANVPAPAAPTIVPTAVAAPIQRRPLAPPPLAAQRSAAPGLKPGAQAPAASPKVGLSAKPPAKTPALKAAHPSPGPPQAPGSAASVKGATKTKAPHPTKRPTFVFDRH